MKVILGILAISTIVLVLIRNRLTTLTKIKTVAAIYRILIYFAIGAMFFYPDLVQSICVILVIAGIQIGIFVDARERFFDYLVSHGDEWCFVPTVKVDKGHYEGYRENSCRQKDRNYACSRDFSHAPNGEPFLPPLR